MNDMSMDQAEAMLEEQGKAWINAANALNRGEWTEARDHLAGPDPALTDAQAYARSVTLCVIGASLCAARIAKLNGHRLGEADGFYGLNIGGDAPAAVRCAAQCVTAACNGQFRTVADLVNAYHRPEDVTTGVDLTVALMQSYLALGGGDE